MQKKVSRSIGNKIFTYYAVVVIPCLIVCVLLVSWYSKNIIQKEFRTNINQIMESTYESMNLMVNDIENVLVKVQSNKKIQDLLGGTKFYRNHMGVTQQEEIVRLKEILLSMDSHYNKISQLTLYVLDREDYPNMNKDSVVCSDKMIKNDVWYNEIMSNDEKTRWDVYYNELDRNSYITVSKVILNTTTCKPIAIIQAKIIISDFTERIDKLSLSKNGKIFLTTATFAINTQKNEYIKQITNNTEYFNWVKSGQAFENLIKTNGKKSMIFSLPLENCNMNLTGMIPFSEFASSTKVLFRFEALMVAIAILLLCLVMFFVTKYVSEPIKTLAKKIGNYDLMSNEAIELSSDDEVEIVAKAFNTLTSTLHNLIEDITTLHEQQQIAKLKLLQAQINPHFLYNTLNLISCMARKYDAQNIERVVLSLSYFFKHSLNGGEENTTIQNEVEHVKSYFEIQNMRFAGKYELNIDVSSEILMNKILKLTLQPLVENCIIHGFKDIDYVGVIDLSGYKKDGKIYITISDNGYGTNVKELNKEINHPEQSKKYGATNVNQRIKLYFGEEYGLKYYENEIGGLVAVICIGDEII